MAKKLVDDACAALRNKFTRSEVAGELVEGYIKDTILDLAAHWPATLIVLGSHGRRGIGRMLLGSVSEAIARHAHCSVEIVRAPHLHETAKDKSQ
jgi:nucleotide-binding universal stress UspA family protein